MKRPITFKQGFKLMRLAECGLLASVFMAVVWVLRGDEVDFENLEQ